MRKKVLFVMNTMGRGGAEVALLALMNSPGMADCDMSLYVMLGQGELIGRLPAGVQLLNRDYDDADVLSADGKRSIRFGSHEMNSKPSKFHYHEEIWTYDPINNVMNVDNTVVRVPYKN